MKKRSLLILLGVLMIIALGFFGWRAFSPSATETLTMCGDVIIEGSMPDCQHYQLYRNIHTEEGCLQIGGDWGWRSGAWQKSQGCFKTN